MPAPPLLAADTKSYSDLAAGLPTHLSPGKVIAGMQDVAMHTAASSTEDEEVFVFPATLAQRRFWLLSQMTPGGNPALNMPLAVQLCGPLDVPALERAFNGVIARHESLRTVFRVEDGELRQIISPRRTMRVPVVDTHDLTGVDDLQREEALSPFDLEKGPLLRARLLRLEHDKHLLLVTLNHITCDGWSLGILLRELATLYGTGIQGLPSPLPELPIQFADFAQWQADVLTSGGLEAQLTYWRRKLAGPLSSLDLPLDHPRSPGRGAMPGECRWRRLPEALAASLKGLAQQQGVTGFMLSLAALGVLLHRYCHGQEDLLVMSPSAGRGRSELEGMIGLFAHPALLRLDLSGQPTFGGLLTRVRATVLEAFANADVPFERLLEEMQPRRLPVNFLQQANFAQPAHSPGLEWVPVLRSASGGAVTEWTAGVIEGNEADGTQLFIEYNTALYDPATVERVLVHFEAILSAVTLPGGMDLPIGSLPFLPREEAGASSLTVTRWRLSPQSIRWMETVCHPDTGQVREGLRLLVLDERRQPAPTGVTGMIFVDDTRLAAGERVRGTGDFGYRSAAGTVVLLGSADGQRLAWIEAALRAHPQVHEAVVLPQQRAGEKQLVAYVQTDGTLATAIVPDTCRLFLRERLTREMIPDVFVRVERFPLTADGRLGEAALPRPAVQPVALAESRPDAPFLTLHYQLIEMWQELLGVRAIGIRDDFFALGGNSLLALRMLNRIEQNYGKALPPAALFKRATVEHLSEEILRLDATANDGKPHTLVAVQEGGTRTPIFYLHGDLTGGGYYCLKLSRRLGTDQPFYALPPVDVSNHREKMPSIEEMAATHVEAIRTVRPHGPYIIGGFCLGGLAAYEVARQLAAAGESVERLIVIDAAAKEKTLKNLRRLAEWKGRRQGLDGEGQLYLFCRWHFLLARMDRWKGLKVREQLAGAWKRAGRFFTTKETMTGVSKPPEEPEGLKAAMLAADKEESSRPVAWFDPRWDVPLVFLWAAGGYAPKSYQGAMTLLLSQDLHDGTDGKLVRDWKRYAPGVQMRGLSGSHLACITEHVDLLADTMKDVLETEG